MYPTLAFPSTEWPVRFLMVHALQRLMATGMVGKRSQKWHLSGDGQTPIPAYPGDIKEKPGSGKGWTTGTVV